MRINSATKLHIQARWRGGGTLAQLARMFGFTEKEIQNIVIPKPPPPNTILPKKLQEKKLVPIKDYKPPQKITPVTPVRSAEKQAILVEAGKKAWETRRRNEAIKKGAQVYYELLTEKKEEKVAEELVNKEPIKQVSTPTPQENPVIAELRKKLDEMEKLQKEIKVLAKNINL